MATKTNPIKSELIDELLSGRDPKTLFESEGLLDELKKALAERVLNAEMDHHLGQRPRTSGRQSPQRQQFQDRFNRCPCRSWIVAVDDGLGKLPHDSKGGMGVHERGIRLERRVLRMRLFDAGRTVVH